MRCRADRDQIARDVNVVHQAGVIDLRETPAHKIAVEMPHIEPDVRRCGSRHLEVYAATDNVARRKLGSLIITRHEAFAVDVEQVTAFAAQRFRDQKARRIRHIERRRVKLNELQISHHRAGAIRHRHAVTGRHVRVRRVQIELPRAACSQNHSSRIEGANQIGRRLDEGDADAAPVFDNQRLRAGMRLVLDGRKFLRPGDQGADDFAACSVAARMQYA